MILNIKMFFIVLIMLIIIENISFSYKKRNKVLTSVSLKVKQNTIHAILGHNGSGKTTLFKLIMGLEKYNNGTIIINEAVIDKKNEVCYMPEFNGFYSELSIYENMVFRYQMSSQSLSSMSDRIILLLKVFGLYEIKDNVVNKLSQGLKKRTALACAIIGKPKLLILDEPTNGVDPKSFQVLIKVLLQLKKTGTTILVSSHNLDFVTKIADEITIINEGKNVYQCSIETLNEEQLKHIYFSYTKEDEAVNYENI